MTSCTVGQSNALQLMMWQPQSQHNVPVIKSREDWLEKDFYLTLQQNQFSSWNPPCEMFSNHFKRILLLNPEKQSRNGQIHQATTISEKWRMIAYHSPNTSITRRKPDYCFLTSTKPTQDTNQLKIWPNQQHQSLHRHISPDTDIYSSKCAHTFYKWYFNTSWYYTRRERETACFLHLI